MAGLFRWKEAAAVLDCGLFLPKGAYAGSAGFRPSFRPSFSSVSVDSRDIEQDALFVALKGERADGHRFVTDAFKAGASGALVHKDEGSALIRAAENEGCALLMVDDPLKALQRLAKAHLDKFPGLLRVGITGSSGKTTTKEIAAAIIGKEKRIVYNAGNLNSDIGLPLSVFKVRAEHQVGIFELGMNRQGEIAEIAGVLRPSFALITNVGTAHIGIIGTKEGIAQEKKAVFSLFTGNETAFIPADSAFAPFLAQDVQGTVCYYAPERSFLREAKDCGIFGWECVVDDQKVRFPLPGRHNLHNAAAAVALAEALGISRSAVAAGLASVRSLSGRGEVLAAVMGGRTVTVINDGYNANPDSMEQALAFFDAAAWDGRKIVAAGEMLELGGAREREHANLFARLDAMRVAKRYFFQATDTVLPDVPPAIAVYDDMERLKADMHEDARENDLVLLKGSRGCALERIVFREQ